MVLVPHAVDWDQPSNTGRLAALFLSTCELAVFGRRDRPLDLESLLREQQTHLLLHPGPDAAPLGPVDGPVRLLVPDGSWRQAGRIASRLARLPGVARVRVDPPPSPALRRAGSPDRVATAFAIAAALDALGEPAPAAHLRSVAEVMVARALRARGKLSPPR